MTSLARSTDITNRIFQRIKAIACGSGEYFRGCFECLGFVNDVWIRFPDSRQCPGACVSVSRIVRPWWPELALPVMTLDFVKEAGNVILLGPNGVGKSTIAQNITYQAIMHGHSALYINAAQMLGDLAAQDGDLALRRRLKHYARPDVLTIDEIGYMTYGDRHADLLFEIVNRRYETKSTIVTTNKAFSEWGAMFPNNGSVVAIVDRLVHHSEIIVIEGESYRMHEARKRAARKSLSPTWKTHSVRTSPEH